MARRALGAAALAFWAAVVPAGCQGPLEKQEAPPARLRIGVVDLHQVFEDSYQRKDVQSEMDRRAPRIVAALQELETEFLAMKARYDELEPGPERTELEERLVELNGRKREIEEGYRRFAQFLQNAQREFMEEARRELSTIAQEGEYDLVLERRFKLEGLKAVGLPAATWSLIHYNRPEMDLTSELTQRLNQRYAREKREVETPSVPDLDDAPRAPLGVPGSDGGAPPAPGGTSTDAASSGGASAGGTD